MVNVVTPLGLIFDSCNPKIVVKNHFDLLTVSSFPTESRTFIERYPVGRSKITVDQIIKDRWFPSRSDNRVKDLSKVFKSRFLVFDVAFGFLKINIHLFQNNDWKWAILAHLVLTDPLFRWFACQFLPSIPLGYDFTKDQVSRDIQNQIGEHVRATTRITFSSKLISALKSLSLLKGRSKFMRVPLEFSHLGFYYFLFLLKSIDFDIDKLYHTQFYLAFFENKDELFSALENLASKGYLAVSWYGGSPKIQLKQVEGVTYR